jgi:hypothetical protein
MQFIFQKKTGFIVSSLLVLAAAVYGAQWKWHFLPINWQKNPMTQESAMDNQAEQMVNEEAFEDAEVAPDEVGSGIREVLSAHLFGQATVTQKITAGGAIPKTQQPLELHGIVFIPNHPERAVALIAQAGGIAQDYKTGEEISILPGWKVHLISPTVVQIEHQDGRVESLELAADLAQSSNAAQPAMNPAAQFNGQQPTQEEIDAGAENAPIPQEELQPVDEVVEAAPENSTPAPANGAPVQNAGQPPVDPAAMMQPE